MEKSLVNISTTRQAFWRTYLEILNPMLNLKNKEIDVLACILLVASLNKENQSLEEHLLDYNSRVKIRSFLKISEASLNNNISELRKKKLLIRTDKGFRVPKSFMEVTPEMSHTIEFRIKIDNNGKKSSRRSTETNEGN